MAWVYNQCSGGRDRGISGVHWPITPGCLVNSRSVKDPAMKKKTGQTPCKEGPPEVVFWPPHACTHMYTHACSHTQAHKYTHQINNIKWKSSEPKVVRERSPSETF